MPYRNADLRKNLTPTIDQVKRYIIKANESERPARDVRPLMSFLQRLPQIDLHLLGLMETRKLAVLGFDYEITMPKGIEPNEREKTQLVEIKNRFERSKMYSIFRAIMNGILFGMSATRLEWKNVSPYGTMVIGKKAIELTDLDIDQDDDNALLLLTTDTKTQVYTVSQIDPDTHIVVRHNPLEGIVNNYIGGYMRTCMIYVMLKYWDVFNWARSNEKFGDPLIYAQYRKGADENEINTVIKGLEQLGTDSHAAFSDDVKIQLAEAMKTGSLQARKELIETISKEMSIALLGQTLTTDIRERGSFAAAKVHDYVRQDILWGDLIEFQNIMTTQYVMRDFILNYGDPDRAFPVFRFITDEAEDFEKNARTLESIHSVGLRVKLDEAYKKTGFTKPDDDDDVLEPSQPPTPLGG